MKDFFAFSVWDSCLLLLDDGDPPPTLRKRPPEGQKEPKTISRARVLPIPGAVPAVFPASPSSRARVVLARVLPVPGALPAVFPASPSAPSPCCTRPCSAHPGRPSCHPPDQPPSAPSPCCTGPCSARPGRPSCRPPGQPFFPEPVLYAPVFSCTSARTPARLLACSPVLRTPALPLARPPAWPACPPAVSPVRPPACTNLYHLFPALPARRPCSPARPPACAPPACAPARILMSPAPPWTARPPVAAGPPSCLPPACPSARPLACRPPARPPTRLPACPLSMSHMPTPMPHVRPCVLGGSTHPHLTRAHSRPAPPHRTTAAPPHTYAGVVGVCCGRNNTAPLPPRMGQH